MGSEGKRFLLGDQRSVVKNLLYKDHKVAKMCEKC